MVRRGAGATKACEFTIRGLLRPVPRARQAYAEGICYWTTPTKHCLDGRPTPNAPPTGTGPQRGQRSRADGCLMTAVTTAPLRGGGAGDSPSPSRVGGFFHRHPGLRLGALLERPLAWVVLLYLGSLALMFVSAFWSLDDFTGQLVREFTLDNFEQLLPGRVVPDRGDPDHRRSRRRHAGRRPLALPLAFFIVKVVRRRSLRSLLIVSLTLPLWAGYLVKGYAWKIHAHRRRRRRLDARAVRAAGSGAGPDRGDDLVGVPVVPVHGAAGGGGVRARP